MTVAELAGRSSRRSHAPLANSFGRAEHPWTAGGAKLEGSFEPTVGSKSL
jgi:hypothetical protein